MNTLEAEIESAMDYEYDPVYTYGDIVLDDNVFTGTYTAEEFLDNRSMNDMARYLGALYRQEDSTITEIEFDETAYEWNEDGELKGSNWEDSEGTTLVSALVDAFESGEPLVVSVSDGVNSEDVTFDLVVTDLHFVVEGMSIQTAIDEAEAGDTILVADGTYSESLTIKVGDLTILGPNAGTPGFEEREDEAVIDGRIVFEADGVAFDGFTVDYEKSEAPIDLKNSDGMSVLNNIVKDNERNTVGIQNYHGTPSAGEVLIEGNVVHAGPIGAYPEYSLIIRNNVVNDAGHEGIWVVPGETAEVIIEGNTVTGSGLNDVKITDPLKTINNVETKHPFIKEDGATLLIDQNNIGSVQLGDEVFDTRSTYALDMEMPSEILYDKAYDIPVTLAADEVGNVGYSQALVYVNVSGPGDITLNATDTNEVIHNLTEVGHWGPKPGFNISHDYSVTTDVSSYFSEPGEYNINFSLVNMVNGEVLDKEVVEFFVEDEEDAALPPGQIVRNRVLNGLLEDENFPGARGIRIALNAPDMPPNVQGMVAVTARANSQGRGQPGEGPAQFFDISATTSVKNNMEDGTQICIDVDDLPSALQNRQNHVFWRYNESAGEWESYPTTMSNGEICTETAQFSWWAITGEMIPEPTPSSPSPRGNMPIPDEYLRTQEEPEEVEETPEEETPEEEPEVPPQVPEETPDEGTVPPATDLADSEDTLTGFALFMEENSGTIRNTGGILLLLLLVGIFGMSTTGRRLIRKTKKKFRRY